MRAAVYPSVVFLRPSVLTKLRSMLSPRPTGIGRLSIQYDSEAGPNDC
jgi:hypothetical protein